MQLIDKTPEKLIFRTEFSESVLNAIRRSVSEIPTLAIDEVEIYKNDSATYDEVLAHRLGLVPLKTEKSMNAKTKIDFKLAKAGPCTIYAEDLQGPAEVVFPKMPLTTIGKNHKLELMATATLGTASEHAKHAPGMVYYRHILNVKSSPQVDKIIQESSSGLIKPEKKGSSWLCDLNDSEINAVESASKDAISDSKEFLVVVESFGLLSAEDVFKKATKSLSDNLDSFEKEIK